MTADLRGEPLGQRGREVTLQILDQVGILGKIGLEQLGVEEDLAVRHQGGQLRRHQPASLPVPRGDHLLRWEVLDLPVKKIGVPRL